MASDVPGDLALVPANDGLRVLELLRRPVPVAAICDATTWPRRAVHKLASRHGLLIDPRTDVAFNPDAELQEAAGDEPVQRLREADIAGLLAAAEGVQVARVRTAADRVTAAAAGLRERLIEAEQTRAAEHLAQQARAEAAAEVERLRLELAAAQDRARQVGVRKTRTPRPASKTTTVTAEKPSERRFRPGRDYDAKQIRAWAKACGRQVPAFGAYLPDSVVAAYLADQPAPRTEAKAAPARRKGSAA